jgi:tripartite-type tricarboxylate transporter receptor subunit TctC
MIGPTCRRALGALATLVLALPLAAEAQTWPNRTITVVIPLAAGNAIDIAGRIVLDQVSKQVGQPIVVENRAGAGGTIGANAAAKAAPDGYTLLVHSSSFAIGPSLYSNLPYDTVNDFQPVIVFGVTPSVLVVAPSRGFKTVNDLVAAAKAKPGELNFASAGHGTASHLAAERLVHSAGIKAQHVPFRGPNEAIAELMGGRVDFYFLPLAPALPFLQSGQLAALAVSTTKRASALPNVPTTTEAGLRDSSYEFWVGLFMPAKTPREIVDRLYQETDKALRNPAMQERLAKTGMEPMPMTSAQFDAHFKNEVAAIAKLVKEAGIKPAN